MTGEPDILTRILARKAEEVAERKNQTPQEELLAQIDSAGPTRGFVNALRKKIEAGKPAVIAEIKKASPS